MCCRENGFAAVHEACSEVRVGWVNIGSLWGGGSLVKGFVLREVGLKVVGVAPAYRFDVYPSAFPFLKGHCFGKAFRWVVDA